MFVSRRGIRLAFLLSFAAFIILIIHFSTKLPSAPRFQNTAEWATSNTLESVTKDVNSKYEIPPHLQPIFYHADEIKAKGHVILITMVNKAFLPFTLSWLCNTKHMNIHKQVLLVATDKESHKELTQKWPEVHTAFWQLEDSLKEGLKYSHAGYVRYMMLRTNMLKELIVSDHEILLFEVDCLWVKNPLPFFLENHSRYDLIGTEIAKQNQMAGGFIYFQPTALTKEEWKKMTEDLQKATEQMKKLPNGKYVSEGINDQVFLQKILQRKDVRYRMFRGDLYPDGKWYSLSEADRKKSDPILINNNWVVGNEPKIARAKKWGHWFLKSDGSCDEVAVKKVVKL